MRVLRSGSLFLLTVMLCSPRVCGQGFDIYGGAINAPCGSNPQAQSFTVSSVARSSGTSTIYLASAPSIMQVGEAFVVSAVSNSIDNGSFNTPAGQAFTVTALSTSSPFSVSFSQSGNNVSQTVTSGTLTEAFWFVKQVTATNRWSLCTPAGNWMYFQGVSAPSTNYLSTVSAKYGSTQAWATQQVVRLKAWGFNGQTDGNMGMGPWSNSSPNLIASGWEANAGQAAIRNAQEFSGETYPPQAPKSPIHIMDRVNGYTGWISAGSQDPFDPNFRIYLNGLFAAGALSYDAPWFKNQWAHQMAGDDRDYEGCFGPGPDIYQPIASPTLNCAWMILGSAPTVYAANYYGNPAQLYPDSTNYGKQELANWLQGTVSTVNITSMICSSGVVTATLASNPFHAGSSAVNGDVVTVAGVNPSGWDSASGVPFVLLTSSGNTVTYSSTCPGPYVSGGTMSLGPGYQSIANLNTAWGSSYTTFGSTKVSHTAESIGTGNGTTLTFSHSLANVPADPFSVGIFVAGTLVGGDVLTSSEPYTIWGPNLSGTVNHSTGALSITFAAGDAPASGAAITVNYTTNGFTHGTGLLDENGAHSWVWVNGIEGTGTNTAAFLADMDHFLFHYAFNLINIYDMAMAAATRRGMLLNAIDCLNGDGGISRKEILLAAKENDVDTYHGYLNVQETTPTVLAQIYTWLGDIPVLSTEFALAGPDSPEIMVANATNANAASPGAATQDDRGTMLAADLQSLFNYQPTGSSPYMLIGYSFFTLVDFTGGADWGLVDGLDDPYDGKSGSSVGVDQWGYQEGGCWTGIGCESQRHSYVWYGATGQPNIGVFFNPLNAPTSSNHLTVDYTVGSTQYTGQPICLPSILESNCTSTNNVGDGSTVGFTKQLGWSALSPGSVRVRMDGNTIATDDGNGNLVGSSLALPQNHGNLIGPLLNENWEWLNFVSHPKRVSGATGGATH